MNPRKLKINNIILIVKSISEPPYTHSNMPDSYNRENDNTYMYTYIIIIIHGQTLKSANRIKAKEYLT